MHVASLDFAATPLIAATLYVLVKRWCGGRSAVAAVVGWLALLAVSHSVAVSPIEAPEILANPQGGHDTLAGVSTQIVVMAKRNLSCAGSGQVLVGLGSLCLLEHLVLPLWGWAALLVAASAFQPQFAFVPLLMMTLLRSRTILVVGFNDKARAAALRCALLACVVLVIKRSAGLHLPVRVDSVTLPLAWWTASWLLDGEALMPHVARILISGILCVSTVANFRAWPALGIVLLAAFVFKSPTVVATEETEAYSSSEATT